MSASYTPVLEHRQAIEVSQAQLSMEPGSIADAIAIQIRTARLKRLWRIEDWLMLRRQRHPRIRRWLHAELLAIGWRKRKR